MKCPNCGNNVPDGSAFCNQCGTPLNSDIQCPSCNSLIPANSVFCPKCGKMVRNDMAETETFNQKQERLRREQEAQAQLRREQEEMRKREERIKEQEARLAAERRALEQSRAQKSFTPPVVEDDEEEEEVVKKSTFNRNLILGISILVGVVLLLLVLRMCNGGSDRDNKPATNDSIAAQTINGQDPLALFNGEMSRSSFMGDNAQTAFAVVYPSRDGQSPSILGVTFKSDPAGKSFYKIYRMKQNGAGWDLELQHTQYINGRALTFNNVELMADEGEVPRMVSVDGMEGLFFAYKNFPQGARDGNTGRISLCFFDANAKKLTTVNYDGTIKTREDGRQYVYGKPLGLVAGDDPLAAKFLKQEAMNIKVIYTPTPEELAAEEEAEKAEEETPAEEENNDKWNQDNADNANAAKAGEEVAVKQQTTDKPMVKKDDMHKSINGANYTVFSDKKGGVYGFNKDTRRYFKIYQSASGTPADIGFADSENGILNISSAEGKFQYNLKTNKLTSR